MNQKFLKIKKIKKSKISDLDFSYGKQLHSLFLEIVYFCRWALFIFDGCTLLILGKENKISICLLCT